MTLSANQAAKLAGKAKGTILTAIESGQLTATKNAKGHWEIDPSELHRVFPYKVTDQIDNQSPKPQLTIPSDHENQLEIARLRAELEGAHNMTEALRDQVADLRVRLDQEAKDRRDTQARLEDLRDKQAMPADRPQSLLAPKPESAPARRGIWPFKIMWGKNRP
jgi:hypothetical protein